MDPSACRVIYIDERFNTERWISRDGLNAAADNRRRASTSDFHELPADLQKNVNAFLSVFNQVYVCRSGRSFSSKLAEIHDQVEADCTPILACFDIGSPKKHELQNYSRPRFSLEGDSPLPSPIGIRREMTFSSENDESYGLQLLSRIASDLQVDDGVKLIIPVAVVHEPRKDSYDHAFQAQTSQTEVARAPYGSETEPVTLADTSDTIDPKLMLQCLDAGALDVVKSPLDKAAIMGLTVHAHRIYKSAKMEQSHYLSKARGRSRKASWVGVDEEKPYAYLREAMVRKLLKGICEPQELIEDYQHRDLYIDPRRKKVVAQAIGEWSFSAQDFTDDELVYGGYLILDHALSMDEVEKWRMPEAELLRFMQGCRVAYNHFVLYHNFKHAVDVLQSTFFFLLQCGHLPPYPKGSEPAKYANNKSPIAKLLGPFEAMTLLISAIGHDVGHPGVNNMFLVKLNAPLAQLYNDTSVLEAFHCAAYSQILRRHWPSVFHDNAIRKLMISSILATDMGCHSDYMSQLGNLQSKIHESKTTDSWTPKEIESNRILTCGLLIKCADISNVARPWAVAEKWTYKLQEEFAHQGEMESNIGMETTLFGGPPEIGNMLKLANGQIGFMTIFAHPLFANVSSIIPAMGFAAEEILVNKGVWFTRAEHEKKVKLMTKRGGIGDGGVSPRSQSPVDANRKGQTPSSPLREKMAPTSSPNEAKSSSLAQVKGLPSPENQPTSMAKPTEKLAEPQQLSLESTKNSSKPLPNGSHDHTESDSATPRQTPVDAGSSPQDSVTAIELNDTRQDVGVSMRAGSAALPVKEMKQAQRQLQQQAPEEALKSFKFATSDVDEPTRIFSPQQEHNVAHPEFRSSAPMNDVEHEQMRKNVANQAQPIGQTPSHTIDSPPLNMAELTPTASTEATSYTTDNRSEDALSIPRSSQQHRDRAISTPVHRTISEGQTCSIVSNDSTSREGSKNDFRTTIISNGDGTGEERKNRKMSTKSVGRRRSKLKMSLAFWKKRNSDQSLPHEAHATTTSPPPASP